MVRTKNTAKKPEDEGRPPLALVSRFHCVDCGKGFGDMTHLRRHAGAVHDHDEVGGPVDPAQKAKYLIWNKRGKRDPAPTLKPPKLPKEPRRKKKVRVSPAGTVKGAMIVIDETGGETSAEEDKPEHGTTPDQPDEPIVLPAIPMAKKGPVAAAGSDAEILRIRVAPAPAELNVTCRRKTQPAKPFVPVRKTAAAEAASPRLSEEKRNFSRRRLQMAPSVLAKKVKAHPELSSTALADHLAGKYSWTPEERRGHVNTIRGMRAMQGLVCTTIRRILPMNRTPENTAEFFATLEGECKQAEQRDSDEFC